MLRAAIVIPTSGENSRLFSVAHALTKNNGKIIKFDIDSQNVKSL